MSRQRAHERRRAFRRDFSGEFRGRRLSPTGVIDTAAEMFRAQIHNVSEGGICLGVDHRLTRFDLIRGEVILPKVAVGIPSLLQVRWTKEMSKGLQYRVGLQFLL